MSLAYILVDTEPGKEHNVYNVLRSYHQVEALEPLFGEYDIMAKVRIDETNSYKSNAGEPSCIGEFVVSKVRTIPGVKDTKTLPVSDRAFENKKKQ
jgi:DNA-binding Lrp family transcriptional regulator